MPFDVHGRARLLVDEARVAGISQEDALWLRSHAAECADCARYEEMVDGIVRGLKSFAFECDPSGSARIQNTAVEYARRPVPRWRWALAAAALLVLTAAPVYRNVQDGRLERADARLLEEVESRVLRLVPVAMEPLVQPQAGESQ
jgi:hypothetical protein